MSTGSTHHRFWIAALLLSVSSTLSAVEFLDYYPRCDYRVIDSVNVKRKMLMENAKLTEEQRNIAREKVLEAIRNMANERAAQGIILTASRIISPSQNANSRIGPDAFFYEMDAQLITLCDENEELDLVAAPVTASGGKAVSLGKIGLAFEIELTLPEKARFDYPDIDSAELISTTDIAGVHFGDTPKQVKAKLGQPSVELALSAKEGLLGFGRSLWLLFQDSRLVEIASQNRWLSTEFVNLLNFDQRFDEHPWTVEGQRLYDAPVEQLAAHLSIPFEQGQQRLQRSVGQAQLYLDVEYFLDHSGGDANGIVKSFSIQHASLESTLTSFTKTVTPDFFGLLYELVIRHEQGLPLTPEDIKTAPIGQYFTEPGKRHWIYPNHVIIEADTYAISHVRLLSSIYTSSQNHVGWRWGELKQGMALDNVRPLLPDNHFELFDEIEVNGAHYLQKLFFYEEKGDTLLSSSTIQLF